MVVFGTLKVGERTGNVLFKGDLERCRQYAKGLDKSKYYALTICENDGTIKERIVKPY